MVIRPITSQEASYNGATHQISVSYLDLQKSTSAANATTVFEFPLAPNRAPGNESSIRFAGAELKKPFASADGSITTLPIDLGRTNFLTAYASGSQTAKGASGTIKLIVPQDTTATSTDNIVLKFKASGAGKVHSSINQGEFVAYFEIHNVAGKDY
jgi:hypothetical protein